MGGEKKYGDCRQFRRKGTKDGFREKTQIKNTFGGIDKVRRTANLLYKQNYTGGRMGGKHELPLKHRVFQE